MKINNPGALGPINYVGTDDYGGLTYYPLHDATVVPPGIYVAKEDMKWGVDYNLVAQTAGKGAMAIVCRGGSEENLVLWAVPRSSNGGLGLFRMGNAQGYTSTITSDVVVRGELLDEYCRGTLKVASPTLSGNTITGSVKKLGISNISGVTATEVYSYINSRKAPVTTYMISLPSAMLDLPADTYFFRITGWTGTGSGRTIYAQYRTPDASTLYLLTHTSDTATITKISLLEDSLTSTSTTTALTANQGKVLNDKIAVLEARIEALEN